jgi:protein tyrosine phosphatase (PTP) superfamily phosphohydrolase (DUF442 family)
MQGRRWRVCLAGWLVVSGILGAPLEGGLLAVAADAPADTAARPRGPGRALPSKELHNLHRVTPSILGGSAPASEAAFAELAALGVKTIVSVDGARPDVAAARRHGLRYVHLPIGYDGISPARVAELIAAAKRSEGPVYVHCHHGRHRGPAAMVVMCAATAGWAPDQRRAFLEQAGTGREYAGLYASVANLRVPEAGTIAGVGELPEVAKTSSTVGSMVAIEEHLERLKSSRTTGFQFVPGHPDLSVPHEAVLLWEQFRERVRSPDSVSRGAAYQESLSEAERLASVLKSSLADPDVKAGDRERALQQVEASCVACHRAHRNVAAMKLP